jgi:hypothetical protein
MSSIIVVGNYLLEHAVSLFTFCYHSNEILVFQSIFSTSIGYFFTFHYYFPITPKPKLLLSLFKEVILLNFSFLDKGKGKDTDIPVTGHGGP